MKITEFEFSRQNYLESGSILKRTRLKMNFSADREFQMTKNDKIGNKNGKVEILKKSDKIDENDKK